MTKKENQSLLSSMNELNNQTQATFNSLSQVWNQTASASRENRILKRQALRNVQKYNKDLI